MRDLRIAGGVFRPAPPSFAAIWMAPNCVFYAHRLTIREGIQLVEWEVRKGLVRLPDGVTAAEFCINRQAWTLAQAGVAGSA